MNKYDAYLQFLATFSLSSFAGLAALLRGGDKLTYRAVASAMMNSGFMGIVIYTIGSKVYAGNENVWFLMGISTLAGLGGNTAIDFFLTLAKSVILAKVQSKKEPEDQNAK